MKPMKRAFEGEGNETVPLAETEAEERLRTIISPQKEPWKKQS
jgi:hypothetical protein